MHLCIQFKLSIKTDRRFIQRRDLSNIKHSSSKQRTTPHCGEWPFVWLNALLLSLDLDQGHDVSQALDEGSLGDLLHILDTPEDGLSPSIDQITTSEQISVLIFGDAKETLHLPLGVSVGLVLHLDGEAGPNKPVSEHSRKERGKPTHCTARLNALVFVVVLGYIARIIELLIGELFHLREQETKTSQGLMLSFAESLSQGLHVLVCSGYDRLLHHVELVCWFW